MSSPCLKCEVRMEEAGEGERPGFFLNLSRGRSWLFKSTRTRRRREKRGIKEKREKVSSLLQTCLTIFVFGMLRRLDYVPYGMLVKGNKNETDEILCLQVLPSGAYLYVWCEVRLQNLGD